MMKALRHTGFCVVIIVFLTMALAAGCSSQTTTEKPPTGETKPPATTAYANPQLLTETAWLKEHMEDEDLVILDAGAPEDYAAGHIKGAVSLPAHSTDVTVGAVPAMLAKPDVVDKMLGDKGVSNDSNVVVYDRQITPPAGRLFWILEYLGHKKVSVLNGGMAKWKKEGGEVTKDAPEVKAATYTPAVNDAVYATKDEVKAMIGKPDAVLVDTRPTLEYVGGHIEGANRIDWMESFTKDDPPLMKSAADLEKVYADAGVTKDKDVALY